MSRDLLRRDQPLAAPSRATSSKDDFYGLTITRLKRLSLLEGSSFADEVPEADLVRFGADSARAVVSTADVRVESAHIELVFED